MAHDSSQRRSSTNAAAGFFTSWLIGALSPSVVVHRRVLRLRIGERWYVSPLPRLSSAESFCRSLCRGHGTPNPKRSSRCCKTAPTVAAGCLLFYVVSLPLIDAINDEESNHTYHLRRCWPRPSQRSSSTIISSVDSAATAPSYPRLRSPRSSSRSDVQADDRHVKGATGHC